MKRGLSFEQFLEFLEATPPWPNQAEPCFGGLVCGCAACMGDGSAWELLEELLREFAAPTPKWRDTFPETREAGPIEFERPAQRYRDISAKGGSP